jgi:S-adenosylmethionine-diacylglycerol 3-amino-3-carboxypropyl transferase
MFMSKKVALDDLIFTVSWEDPELDRQAFGGAPGQRIATVGSGGCNALTFLLDDPAEVYAFDYNQTQVWLLELKKAAFRVLTHPQLLEFFGVTRSNNVHALFQRLKPALPGPARAYFEDSPHLLRNGLLGHGRYERFVAAFRRALRLLQGTRKIHELLTAKSAAAQSAFYDTVWNTPQWRLLFTLFFNRYVLARRGLAADYFHFADSSMSFAHSFEQRTKLALTTLPAHQNPFIAYYLCGAFTTQSLPLYLRAEHFDTIRNRIDRLSVTQLDVREFEQHVGRARFNSVCLSNVFELMSDTETQAALAGAARCLAPNGVLTLRNLMIPRTADTASGLTLNAALSESLHAQDRSFIYRAFHVYNKKEVSA